MVLLGGRVESRREGRGGQRRERSSQRVGARGLRGASGLYLRGGLGCGGAREPLVAHDDGEGREQEREPDDQAAEGDFDQPGDRAGEGAEAVTPRIADALKEEVADGVARFLRGRGIGGGDDDEDGGEGDEPAETIALGRELLDAGADLREVLAEIEDLLEGCVGARGEEFEKLLLDTLLVSEACIDINGLLGDVLAGGVLGDDGAESAELVENGAETAGGDPESELGTERGAVACDLRGFDILARGFADEECGLGEGRAGVGGGELERGLPDHVAILGHGICGGADGGAA